MDLLKMLHTGAESIAAKSLKNQFGVPPGPGALMQLIHNSLHSTSSGNSEVVCLTAASATTAMQGYNN